MKIKRIKRLGKRGAQQAKPNFVSPSGSVKSPGPVQSVLQDDLFIKDNY